MARCCVSYHGSLSLDPFSSIVASLKAMQCIKLRAKGRFIYGCVFVIAPLCNCEVCVNTFQTKMWRYDLDKFGAKLIVRAKKNYHSERK